MSWIRVAVITLLILVIAIAVVVKFKSRSSSPSAPPQAPSVAPLVAVPVPPVAKPSPSAPPPETLSLAPSNPANMEVGWSKEIPLTITVDGEPFEAYLEMFGGYSKDGEKYFRRYVYGNQHSITRKSDPVLVETKPHQGTLRSVRPVPPPRGIELKNVSEENLPIRITYRKKTRDCD